jgi:Kef-type K+ transport system membrane component KefB
MPAASFTNLLAVVVISFSAPFLLGLLPRLRIPAVVLEIVAGIVVGPAVLRWVRVDLPVQILALLGLAFLLFLAGTEIDLQRLRGRAMRLALSSFAISALLGLLVGYLLFAIGLVRSPLLVAIILLATSLGLVVPVLKDAGEASTPFGQLVIAAASVADFGAVILLSLFFSREASAPVAKGILILGFVTVAVLLITGVKRLERAMRLSALLVKLQDTTAEIRVRASILLLIAFVALAERLGLETILAAFLAGATLRLVDQDQFRTHPNFRVKLEAIGYGFLIPIFFVTSGLQFDLRALFGSPSTVLRLPLFLLALLAVRGLPAIVYRGRRLSRSPPRGRLAASDVAAVHRRGQRDWHRARPDYSGDGGRAGRRRPALGRPLPRHCHHPAPRSRNRCPGAAGSTIGADRFGRRDG